MHKYNYSIYRKKNEQCKKLALLTYEINLYCVIKGSIFRKNAIASGLKKHIEINPITTIILRNYAPLISKFKERVEVLLKSPSLPLSRRVDYKNLIFIMYIETLIF